MTNEEVKSVVEANGGKYIGTGWDVTGYDAVLFTLPGSDRLLVFRLVHEPDFEDALDELTR